MVKKLTPEDDDKQFADAVRESAQQIWQAGLGAFAKAQEEGGRVFSKLVKEGSEMQKRARAVAEERAAAGADAAGKQATGAGKPGAGSWDKLEQVFEERVARALGAIGVPNRKEVEALARQVEQLSQDVAALSAQHGAARPAARKSAARPPGAAARAPKAPLKPAAKKSAARAGPKKAPVADGGGPG